MKAAANPGLKPGENERKTEQEIYNHEAMRESLRQSDFADEFQKAGF